jgi:hypothetical protein
LAFDKFIRKVLILDIGAGDCSISDSHKYVAQMLQTVQQMGKELRQRYITLNMHMVWIFKEGF